MKLDQVEIPAIPGTGIKSLYKIWVTTLTAEEDIKKIVSFEDWKVHYLCQELRDRYTSYVQTCVRQNRIEDIESLDDWTERHYEITI